MTRPLPRLGLPAALAVFLVVSLFGLLPARTGFALDDIARPLLESRTVRCTTTGVMKGMPVLTTTGMFRGSKWRQTDEARGTITIHDSSAGTTLTLQPKEKSAHLLQALNRDPKDIEQSDFLSFLRNAIQLKEIDERITQVALGEREVGGKTLVGYRLDGGGARMDLWGEKATGLPHSIVMVMASFPDMEVTMADFEFDVAIDESMLSLIPPAGYTVTRETIDMSLRSESGLVKALAVMSDLNDGVYPDTINVSVAQRAVKLLAGKLTGQAAEEREATLKHRSNLLRAGFAFANQLPREADATYAGRGVSRNDADRAIFWYKPEGEESYRVLYADLTFGSSDTEPDEEGIQKLALP